LASLDLKSYYRRRAAEYEAIYAKPERQADLARLRRLIPERLAGRRVLEIACGTGYWTRQIAPLAREVVATDAVDEPMQIARGKSYPAGRVRFVRQDAYALGAELGRFDAALAVFWWSHVPRRRIPEFLSSLHARLEPGSLVIMMDNLYVEGSSTPIARCDEDGNTYQIRRLADGSETLVLKNFPNEAELTALGRVEALQYYWLVEYRAP
jgi:demethylmenaquinone methyltransferase/2-methoxy-6-polyprenyl-1,4-benzoquinol methylase